MQVHYNLLVGDKPVKNSLMLHTVPASTPLLPLKLDLMPAPPDMPVPGGRDGAAVQPGRVFGQPRTTLRVGRGELRERHRIDVRAEPERPPGGRHHLVQLAGEPTGYIVRVGAHMHLLGVSFKMVLNPGTPHAKTILNVPDYNFHYQKRLRPGDSRRGVARGQRAGHVHLQPGAGPGAADPAQVPPHFVTWGDGSSDEMCLGLMWTSTTLPNPSYPV